MWTKGSAKDLSRTYLLAYTHR